MQIRTKVILSLLMLIVILSSGLKVTLDQLIRPEFEEIEKTQFQDDIDHIRTLLAQETQRMETMAYDWAVWDQADRFVRGNNPGFYQSNLSDSTARELQIDQMFFVDLSGRVIWHQITDKVSGVLTETQWPEQHFLFQQTALTSSGLLLTDNGPYLYSRSAITAGDTDQQRSGIVVMLKALNQGLLDNLAAKPTTLSLVDSAASQTHTRFISGQQALTTTTLVFANNREKLLQLQQKQPRTINYQANKTITTVFAISLGMGVIVTLAVFMFLRQHILIPIGRLNKEAEAFGDNHTVNSFSTPQRQDEIGRLAFTFRQMAEQVVAYQRNLVMEKQSLEHASLTDQLTGLFNRRYMDQVLPQQINHSGIEQWTLVMLDMDHFKAVNDTYGHDTGDLVLQQFAELLQAHSREEDHCIRYGGEEFLLVIPHLSSQEAQHYCERIRTAVQQYPFGSDEQPLQLSVSQGFLLFNQQGDVTAELLDQYQGHADTALYAAKHGGRNCWMGIDGQAVELPREHSTLLQQLQQGQISVIKSDPSAETHLA